MYREGNVVALLPQGKGIIDEIVEITAILEHPRVTFGMALQSIPFVARARNLLGIYSQGNFAIGRIQKKMRYTHSGREIAAQITRQSFNKVYGVLGYDETRAKEELMCVLGENEARVSLYKIRSQIVALVVDAGVPSGSSELEVFGAFLDDFLNECVGNGKLPDKEMRLRAQRFFTIWRHSAKSVQFRVHETSPS